MKKHTLLALTLLSLTLTIGCTPKAADISTTEIAEAPTTIATEAPSAVAESVSNDLKIQLDDLIASKSGSLAMKQFVMDFSNDLDHELATVALSAWIDALNEEMMAEIELYYAEDTQSLHAAIADTVKNHAADFESTSTVLSTEASSLAKGINDPKQIKIIESSFEKGYALVSAEGTYYPVIDYVTLSDTYSKQVTPDMSEFLKLMALEQISPLTSEEYLAVSPNELGQRALSYENYLSVYPSGVYRENIRILLMTSLWKIVSPTPFDGLLTEDFKISPDLAATYEELLKHAEAPVVLESVEGVIAFAESKNGILGSYENMDALTEESYKLHQTASDAIAKLYHIIGETIE